MSPAGYSLALLSSKRLRFAGRLLSWGSSGFESIEKYRAGLPAGIVGRSDPFRHALYCGHFNRRKCGRFIPVLTANGVLALHVSNSFLDLVPVVGRAAQALGKVARIVEVQENVREHRGHSLWMLLADRPQTLDRLLPAGTWRPAPAPTWLRVWTDDYSNLFQILK